MRFLNARTLLVAAGITVGAVFLLAGLAGLGFYAYTVIDVMDGADRSLIFWYLVFAEAGVVLLGAGGFFVGLAVWTHRDPDLHSVFLGGSLLALLVVGIAGVGYLLVEWESEERARKRWARTHATRQKLARTMHRLERLEVTRLGEDGFTVQLAASGQRADTYRLTLTVSSGRTEFLRATEHLVLASGDTSFRRRVAYRDLFKTCDTTAEASRVPVCVDGAGARTFWTVEARLTLRDEASPGGPVSVELDPAWDRSSKRVQLMLDTFTENGTVDVREARRKP